MKYRSPQFAAPRGHRLYQRGISLIIILLILVLVGLTALSASRSAMFNESVTGNEADYNRALAAAESLIRDAQVDIVGYFSPTQPCQVGILYIGCRLSVNVVPTVPTLLLPFFPQPKNGNDADELRNVLSALPIPCVKGICAPVAWPANALPDRFWLRPDFMATYVPLSATYGEFTQANGVQPGVTSNPILTAGNHVAANAQAWYWVELIPGYAEFRCGGNVGCPNSQSPYMYRVTAVARGRRNTMAVIQNYFVPSPPVPGT